MHDSIETTARFTPGKIAFQLVGFAISIALLVWVIRRATSEENAENLERLREARIGPVLGLLALTAASVTLNGLIFWATARPIRRLRVIDVICVNSIATFLSILPFKLGFLSRAVIHRRRDQMRIVDLASWFISVSLLGLSVFVPLGVISLWRGELDGVWWAASSVSILGVLVAAVVLGRLSEDRPWLARMSLGSWRVVKHPGTVVTSTAFRLMDVAALGGRFLVAGAIIGLPITFTQAGMHGTVFYLVSVASPAGVLGFRETASERLGLAADAAEQFALAALLVTFTEILVSGAMALAGAIYLRVDKLALPERMDPDAEADANENGPLRDGEARKDPSGDDTPETAQG